MSSQIPTFVFDLTLSYSVTYILNVNTSQDRCEALGKERSAVLTILEQKVLVLVESVARAAGVVVGESDGGGSQTSEVEHALMKVQHLFCT